MRFGIIGKSKNDFTLDIVVQTSPLISTLLVKMYQKKKTDMSYYPTIMMENHLKSAMWEFSIALLKGYKLG